VSFVEAIQRGVVNGFERRDHEQTSGFGHLRPDALVAQHVLHLHGAVEGDVGKPFTDRAHDPQGMVGPVQEVGVAEREVSGAGGNLLCRIGDHSVELDDAQPSVVDHGDGAVPAPMCAAMAGLDVSDDALFVPDREVGVVVERGEEVSGGERDVRLCSLSTKVDSNAIAAAFDPIDEGGVGLAAEHVVGNVIHEWAIEAVTSDRQLGALFADARDRSPSDAHRGVHRHRERDPLGPRNEIGVPRLDREIQAPDVVTAVAQLRSGRSNQQRLMPELVRSDEEDAHQPTRLAIFVDVCGLRRYTQRVPSDSTCSIRSTATSSPKTRRNTSHSARQIPVHEVAASQIGQWCSMSKN
jgi:hypothetical protein